MYNFWPYFSKAAAVTWSTGCSLVRYVILAIYVAKIDFIVFMASLGVK